MKTKENYFLDTAYECQTECIRDGFWTESRIAKEPFNGSRAVMEWVAKRLEEKQNSLSLSLSLLDVGCGPASKLPMFFPNYKITGIDTKEAVALAQKNNPQGIFYACNLDDDIEIASVSEKLGKFDVILCIDVIEHALFPEKMLRLIRKHLLPGRGEAYIATLERDISRGADSGRQGSPIKAHIREWNQDEFAQFIRSEGFLIHECKLTPLSIQPMEKTRHMRVQTLRCSIPGDAEVALAACMQYTMQQLKVAMETDLLLDNATQIAVALANDNADIMHVLSSRDDAGCAEKYREASLWIPKHLALCHILELHRRQGLRILDLGCGPGWFSWLSGVLGHTPTGLDIPGRPDFYRELCSAMGVPVVEHKIKPYEPLPDSLKNYDVIVLLMAAFYFDQRWDNMDSWRFFLKDLDSRIAPGGTILFEMNAKYGLLCSAEQYDVFTEFGYRIVGKFCIKTRDANLYNAIQRYEYSQNSFASIWYRAGHAGYDSVVWPHIDLLTKAYPRAVDLSVQLAMSKILRGDGESAVSLLENAVRMRPQRLGYGILLAQLLFARGEREKALAVIQNAMPRNALPEAWEQMLRADETVPVARISPYWGWACQLLTRSSVWRSLLEERKDLSDSADPVSWYLRYGTPLLPVAAGFTPLIYWGINYDVLLSGQDPLLHYIAYGKSEQRKI